MWYVIWKSVDHSLPAAGVKIKRAARKKVRELLTEEEYRLLINGEK